MKVYAPTYYKNFRCIASQCRHSCCIGWEIDIDDESLKRYRECDGGFGIKLNQNISSGEVPHFTLSDNDRCPFLNEDNLCEIYIHLGKDALCDICREHPRYRNFYESFEELGVGLSCEVAAELILKNNSLVTECISDDGKCDKISTEEEEILNVKKDIADILYNNDIFASVTLICERYNLKIPDKSFEEWLDIYLNLEILNDEWKNELKLVKNITGCGTDDLSKQEKIYFKNLLSYFVFRHINSDMEYELSDVLAFCILSVKMIMEIFLRTENRSFEFMREISRSYSAEIEYSTENISDIIFEMNI